ncbi:protein serine/threonine kinase, putative, partial [Entamoeba invadens IP1]
YHINQKNKNFSNQEKHLSHLKSGMKTACGAYCNNCQYNICYGCYDGYYLSNYNCYPCVLPCATCSGQYNGNCKTCTEGYYLVGSTCYKCPSGCMKCTLSRQNTFVCEICGYGYYKDTSKICIKCDKTCGKCDGTSYLNCTSCATQFYNATNNENESKCTNCDSKCNSCNGPLGVNCLECISGYYKVDDKCVPCDISCSTCNGPESSNCTSCSKGFYQVNQTDNSLLCEPCVSNCSTCEKNGECLLCDNGFYLYISKCYSCDSSCKTCFGMASNNCLTCRPGLAVRYGTCYDCQITNCFKCFYDAQGYKCNACYEGFYLKGYSVCASCNSLCHTCYGPTNGECNSCISNYYISESTCKQCYPLCLECFGGSNGNCTSCKSGNYIHNHYCYPCHSSCEECYGPSIQECTKCKPNHYLNSTECISCDPSCNECHGSTNTECTSCASGFSFDETHTCLSCNNSCSSCNITEQSICTLCDEGFYLDLNSSNCVSCYTGCSECTSNEENDCSKCFEGFYLNGTTCALCNNKCSLCSEDFPDICVKCKEGYYLNGTECLQCSSTCLTCDTSQDNCTSCRDGEMYLYDNTCNICSHCSPGHCYHSQCDLCENAHYYNILFDCFECNETCFACDESLSTDCLSCYNTSYLEDRECKPCGDTCEEDKCDMTEGCIECKIGNYPENKTCHQCSDILNCVECSQTNKTCNICGGNFEPNENNTECFCKSGYYRTNLTNCSPCYEGMDYCKNCHNVNDTYDLICVECYDPYYLNEYTNNTCKLCSGNYYLLKDKITHNVTCGEGNANCILRLNESLCVLCEDNFYIQNGTCVTQNDTNCSVSSNVTCEMCEDENILSVNGKCETRNVNCKYFENNFGPNSKCFTCIDNYTSTTSDLINCTTQIPNDKVMKNGIYYSCSLNEYVNQNNECKSCAESAAKSQQCNLYNKTISVIDCPDRHSVDYNTETCINDDNCQQYEGDDCVSCSTTQHFVIDQNTCTKRAVDGCASYDTEKCIKCINTHILFNGTCVESSNLSCDKSTGYSCVLCQSEYHRISDVTGVSYCLPNGENVKYAFSDTQRDDIITVLECVTDTFLNNNSCMSNAHNTTVKGELNDNCKRRTPKGCIQCEDSYYLDEYSNCVTCTSTNTSCVTCVNASYCLSCPNNSFLNAQNQCEPSTDLEFRCQQMMPKNTGCAICKETYYKERSDCLTCDSTCQLCKENSKCVSCKNGYFQITSENYLCQAYSSLTNCITKTQLGCTRCEDRYYLNTIIPRCYPCQSNCSLCVTGMVCNLCDSDYILIDGTCKHYTEINFCLSESHNLCSKCDKDKKLSDDGLSCVDQINLPLVIALPISLVFVIVLVTIALFLLWYFIRQHNKRVEEMKKICVFNMKRSNISFTNLNESVAFNMTKIVFESDTNENSEISVDEETRSLICVGNVSKNRLKIQFSVIDGCDLFDIRTEPKLITLDSNYACEFEVFLKPNCSCCIDDAILCISLDIKKGEQKTTKISVTGKTILTTKLDINELHEERKLGEGSFGIVYYGHFRGHEVAIKRLKSGCSDVSSKKEFEKEVLMLDKFRSDFIVHFFGAVFIPTKICLVTEFAQYGSLADLMKHKQNDEIPIKTIQHKLLLDMAKGISYLHNNGIVHRDIKPDNLLVFSLDIDELINAKLTDFGSARNVNMLMNNMTFTKGIGTPKYMAPEVLKKEKYQMPSDIYSLAITFYECLIWEEPYPKQKFKFAWSVADFVTAGKHLEQLKQITTTEYTLLNEMWRFDAQSRIKIDDVVEKLKTI